MNKLTDNVLSEMLYFMTSYKVMNEWTCRSVNYSASSLHDQFLLKNRSMVKQRSKHGINEDDSLDAAICTRRKYCVNETVCDCSFLFNDKFLHLRNMLELGNILANKRV